MLDPGLLMPAAFSGGDDRDVVVMTSVRLGRNLEDALYPNRAPITEALETRGRIMAAITRIVPDCIEVHAEEIDAADALLLSERGWADPSSSSDPGRALAVTDSGSTILSLNDTDHLRIVVSVPGNDGGAAFSRARELDEALDAELGWAATAELGYLSARIEECGSALRLSALVFIPGILTAGVLERVARGLLASGIEPHVVSYGREAETGEPAQGDESAGEGRASPYVELISQAPRGVSEEDFIAGFREALSGLIEGERRTRERVISSRRAETEDAAWRAAALLRGARLLSEGESRRLIADLRAGVSYGVAPTETPSRGEPYAALDRARLLIGTGQVRVLARRRGGAATVSLDALRAELVREALPRYDIA